MTAHPYGSGWAALRRATFKAKGRACWWYGRPATTVDHVLAVVLGGTNELANLVPACARCNYSRGASLGNRLRGAGMVPVSRSWRTSRRW
jgi:5-methylcytosine-specific restriction endonuclease McrA